MRLIEDLLQSVADFDCDIRRVCVGLHWTVIESKFAGMAHTYKTSHKVEINDSGKLSGTTAFDLAGRALSWEPLNASLGLAAINSLLNVGEMEFEMHEANVGDWIKEQAEGKVVTIIGRFPFADEISRIASKVYRLEMDPVEGELPAAACEYVMPLSDVNVITATTIINHTIDRLLELGHGGVNIVLGPSTPLHPLLFEHGADILAGVLVDDPDALAKSIVEGTKTFKRLDGIRPVVVHKRIPK